MSAPPAWRVSPTTGSPPVHVYQPPGQFVNRLWFGKAPELQLKLTDMISFGTMSLSFEMQDVFSDADGKILHTTQLHEQVQLAVSLSPVDVRPRSPGREEFPGSNPRAQEGLP